jgi:hypothetical protein
MWCDFRTVSRKSPGHLRLVDQRSPATRLNDQLECRDRFPALRGLAGLRQQRLKQDKFGPALDSLSIYTQSGDFLELI